MSNMEPPPTDLDWVQLHKDMNSAENQIESSSDKLARKIKENPFVPVGCGLTTAALVYGLWNFKQGRTQMSQTMMRARIVAQGFTIAALVGGVIMTGKAMV